METGINSQTKKPRYVVAAKVNYGGTEILATLEEYNRIEDLVKGYISIFSNVTEDRLNLEPHPYELVGDHEYILMKHVLIGVKKAIMQRMEDRHFNN